MTSKPTVPSSRLLTASAAILTAAILYTDFATNALGLINTLRNWTKSQPTPVVRVTPISVNSGAECLQFAFSSLPDHFALGEIHLDLTRTTGLTRLSGDMSAEILHLTVNHELSPSHLLAGDTPIVFSAPFQAERPHDNAYVDFCPTIATPRLAAQLHVLPSFLTPAGDAITDLKILSSDGSFPQEGIPLRLSRPANVAVSLDPTRTRLVPLQPFDTPATTILDATTPAETPDDLVPLLTDTPPPDSSAALWMYALGQSSTDSVGTSQGRRSIARAMELALLLAGAPPHTGSLYALLPEDIVAMRATVGFPGDGDLVTYLLNRGPSLTDTFTDRQAYDVVRNTFMGQHFIHERVNAHPYLGISAVPTLDITQWDITSFSPEDDPVSAVTGENAQSRRFSLSTLPYVVLAAKAFRAATRSSRPIYPLLVASQALNRALALEPDDYRILAYSAEAAVSSALRGLDATDSHLRDELRRSQIRLPQAALFAQLFSESAELFATLSSSTISHHDKVAADWGEAIARFAQGAPSSPVFARLVDRIDERNWQQAALLYLFLDHLPQPEAEQLGNVAQWRERAEASFQSGAANIDPATMQSIEDRFTRLLATIGRSDIVIPFIEGRLESVSNTPRETELLRRLGYSLQRSYGLISFQLTPDGAWVHRPTNGYNAFLDFIDGPIGGRDSSSRDGIPYAAVNPVEDRIEAMRAYLDMPPPGSIGTSPLEVLIQESMSRTDSGASIVPYLKLAWIDWFAFAFQAALQPTFRASEFRYEPLGLSPMMEPHRVRELGDHPAATDHQIYLIELFVRSRLLLERLY